MVTLFFILLFCSPLQKDEKKHYLRITFIQMKKTTEVRLKTFFQILLIALPFTAAKGQTGDIAFNFLRLPHSSHAAALGGNNISIIEDDITLAAHNPALLINSTHNTFSLGYMSYMSDSKVASAAYGRVFNERAAGAIFARYVDYGEFEGYTPENIYTGTFTAKDMVFSATYSHLLSEKWSGGVTGNFIYSKYETMSSVAIGVDLGLNYYDEENNLSASLVAKNLGAQITAFEDKTEKMPFDLQLGVTKKLSHAPLRLSVTMVNLHKWSSNDFYNADGSKDNTGQKIFKHFIFGADFLFSERFYAAVGYNYRTSKELSSNGSKWDGFSIGAGLNIKKIKLNASYSKLHVSSSSLLFNVSYTL